jgi:hypothetical protein
VTSEAPTKKFELGRVVATPGAIELAEEKGISLTHLLALHVIGEWGNLDAHDKRMNEQALKDGSRLLSSYGENGDKLYVITDAATDVCPACWAGIGTCEPDKGSHLHGQHFRDDLPPRRVSTTVLKPSEY